jgi:hypothetical protein
LIMGCSVALLAIVTGIAARPASADHSADREEIADSLEQSWKSSAGFHLATA